MSPELIADLQRYMGVEIPTDIAHKVLTHAKAQHPGAGNRWLVERAAQIYRQRDQPLFSEFG